MGVIEESGVASRAGKILILPGDVVSRIAAGEVIERPAAVVKELVENSLDAGSSRITIEVRDGGLRGIRVLDDGEGMSRGDALLAFQRHATSKLRSDRDLDSIRTMGFRGEALPSIASVAKVRMLTSTRSDTVGTEVRLDAGEVRGVEDCAAPPGTQIEVSELFFKTPARRKFLKSPSTEFSHISQVVQQTSLAWPGVHFRLRHNGQDVLDLPAVSSRRERVLQSYPRRFLEQCHEVHARQEGLALEGYVIDPTFARAGRSPQDVFVNQRRVRSSTISHAVYDGYDSLLAKGRHPLFVLFLEVDPDRVDVNVHPTKREVRFLHQDVIHREVRRAIREALAPGSPSAHEPSARSAHAPSVSPDHRLGQDGGGTQLQGRTQARLEWAAPTETVGEGWVRYGDRAAEEVVPLGQVRKTFLVAQVGGELQVVDQHTAHERVLYERLVRAWSAQTVSSQPLLIPEPLDLPAHEAVLLRERLPDLERLGMSIEPFGASSFVVRAVPAMLGRVDYGALVRDLLEDLTQWNTPRSLDARVQPLLATLACHGAVRAGRPLGLPEIKQLIEDWVGEGLVMTCPHGRRVALRLSTEELEKIFGRA